jgi:hypothetical protein
MPKTLKNPTTLVMNIGNSDRIILGTLDKPERNRKTTKRKQKEKKEAERTCDR